MVTRLPARMLCSCVTSTMWPRTGALLPQGRCDANPPNLRERTRAPSGVVLPSHRAFKPARHLADAHHNNTDARGGFKK